MPTFALRSGVSLASCVFGSNAVVGGRYDVKARLTAGGGSFVEENDGVVQRLRELRDPGGLLLQELVVIVEPALPVTTNLVAAADASKVLGYADGASIGAALPAVHGATYGAAPTGVSGLPAPIFRTAQADGKPAFEFGSGQNADLRFGDISAAFAASQAGTLVLVANILAPAAAYKLFNTKSASSVDSFWRYDDGGCYIATWHSPRYEGVGGMNFPATGLHVIALRVRRDNGGGSVGDYQTVIDGTAGLAQHPTIASNVWDPGNVYDLGTGDATQVDRAPKMMAYKTLVYSDYKSDADLASIRSWAQSCYPSLP